jgi:hypothetical protein
MNLMYLLCLESATYSILHFGVQNHGFPDLHITTAGTCQPLEPPGSQICWARGEVLMFLKSLRLWWDMMGSYEGVQFMGVRLNHPFPRMFRYKPKFWGFPSLGNPHIQSIRCWHVLVSIQHIRCLLDIQQDIHNNIREMSRLRFWCHLGTSRHAPGCDSDAAVEPWAMEPPNIYGIGWSN